MSEADDEISEALWELARDPKYAEIADTLAEAAGHIHDLNATVDMEVPRWRPIDTAPKDGTTVLLYHKHCGQYTGEYRLGRRMEPAQEAESWRAMCCGRFTAPTHWQPLPAPPEEPHD